MTLILIVVMSITISLSYWLEENTKWISHISGVLLIIIISAILGNAGIVPNNQEAYSLFFNWGVPFGIVLMLLAFEPKHILQIKKEFLVSFAIGAFGTIIGGLIAGVIFKHYLPDDYWRVSAQLTATFIGGYENAVAVGRELNMPTVLFVTIFAGDSILTSLWMSINILQGKNLPPEDVKDNKEKYKKHFNLFYEIDITSLTITISTALVILAIGSYLHTVLPKIPKIIWLSALATGTTFFKPITSRLKNSYIIGSFVLSYFFFACGAISNVIELFNSMTILLLFPATIVFIHAVIIFSFGKILKINRKTTIVASQSLIGGPATALAVVTARKWEYQFEAIVLGLLGYAVANYLGLMVALILKGGF